MLVHDVAALYVDRNGLYPGRFEHWYDDRKDARTYSGDLPVIAHPPCQRWCRLAGLVEARWGLKRGEDGGLFAHALGELRRVGGVLEHPAYSDAWAAYGLPRPETGAGWCKGASFGEWTCYVEQWRYGHRAKKATWLYYVGLRRPFDLDHGVLSDHAAAQFQGTSWAGNKGLTNWRDSARRKPLARFNCGLHNSGAARRLERPTAVVWTGPDGKQPGSHNRNRLTKKEARATPPDFLDVLTELARWSQTE